jgi:molecular chaperone HtpG
MAAGVVVVAALLCGLGGERSAFRAPRAPASLASLRGGVDVPQPPIDAFATAAAAAAAAAPEADVSEPESFAFRAEMAQLMSLIINTFYSNKDIFLRELISNAADAIDKARFGSVDSSSAPPLSADGGGASPAADEIRLTADAAAQTLTIEDSGVGMSRDDLIAFLGTVARSGTKAFMQQAVAAAAAAGGGGGAGAAELIGQFGVGFYSAFLVAERVTVYTRKAGGPLLAWESAAEGGYTIRKPTEAEVAARAGERSRLAAGGRGTAVVLALKPEASVYLAESKLAELVRTHSAFVAPPIKLWARRRRLETDTAPADGSAPPSPAEEAAAMLRAAMAADAAEAGEAVESVDASADERLAVWDWRPLNELKPLWLRAPGEISESEYAAFYKSVSGDWQPPLARKHFAVEGAALQLRALLFTPRGGGLDALDGGSARASARGIKLYVRRVFVCDAAAADFLPDWAAFARGVIDSDSLELNVSREHLQRSAAIGAIRKALTKRVLEMVEEMAAEDKRATAAAADATTAVDADGGGRLRYDEFYAQWGKNLKLGVHEDERSRARLLALLRFPSTHSLPSAAAVSERAAADVDGGARSAGSGLRASEMSSLDEYVGRMPAHQTAIYYLSGESLRAVRAAPALELAVARGFEVLFLVEPIDEYAIARVGTFKGKRYGGHRPRRVRYAPRAPSRAVQSATSDEPASSSPLLATWVRPSVCPPLRPPLLPPLLASCPSCLPSRPLVRRTGSSRSRRRKRRSTRPTPTPLRRTRRRCCRRARTAPSCARRWRPSSMARSTRSGSRARTRGAPLARVARTLVRASAHARPFAARPRGGPPSGLRLRAACLVPVHTGHVGARLVGKHGADHEGAGAA